MLKPKQFLVVGIFSVLGVAMGTAYATAYVLAQGVVVKATIVPGESTLLGAAGAKAFSPNPISVEVGGNVTWTNKDTQAHTVVSGTGSSDPNKGKLFDSGLTNLIQPGKSYSFKFTPNMLHSIAGSNLEVRGAIPYFCQIHPAMVGKIEVITSIPIH
jgi:plastocyanin